MKPGSMLALLALVALIVLVALAPLLQTLCASRPVYWSVLSQLQTHWFEALRPPLLAERRVVYCSGPLFNLSEIIYALGWQGLLPPGGSLETINGLDAAQLAAVAAVAKVQGLPPYGLCGELARRGFEAYCPARDGFTLAVILASISSSTLPDAEKQRLSGYMSKAIYAIDAFCLGGLCNCGLLNANGLQIDDGSATEVGMMGMRGMPLVIYRDQATAQLGPKVLNPMPIGNASAALAPTGYDTVQAAVEALSRKVDGVLHAEPTWVGAATYARDVPPPPLYIYWQTVGEAVFSVKFRRKRLTVDAQGRLDAAASYTPFFYANYVTEPTPENILRVAQAVAAAIVAVEQRFAPLIAVYPEAARPPDGAAGYGR
jgi:hypothetical protein